MDGEALDDTPRAARPILIFGAPRSGTSLLSRLLDSHSRIAIPFESHLFNQWLPRLAAYGDLSALDNRRRLVRDIVELGVVNDWDTHPTVDDIEALIDEPTFGGVSRAILDWWAATQDKPRWGEKTPHHTLLHKDALTAWPEALVVIIERDPRDVALSWKEARFGGDHVLPFANAWVRYLSACDEVRATLPPNQWIELRYEDLVRSPKAELERVMTFLGEAYEPAQLDFHQGGGADWHTDARNERKLRQPISEQSIGRWRSGLSAREVKLVEAIAGPDMARRGYDLSADAAALSGAEMAMVNWIERPLGRVLGLLKNRRGLTYLVRDIRWKLRSLREKSV